MMEKKNEKLKCIYTEPKQEALLNFAVDGKKRETKMHTETK